MAALQRSLEDACFRILDPQAFEALERSLGRELREREQFLHTLVERLRLLLDRNSIAARVEGRSKGLLSMYRKACRRHLPLSSMTDALGVRLIVASEAECYAALDLVHGLYRPLQREADDWIALPKRNGYRSIHTVVSVAEEVPELLAEIQIRTWQMHLDAESGAAAHWRYKTHGGLVLRGRAAGSAGGMALCCPPCGCILQPKLG
jgi:GTP pyrophosphokinase